MNLNTLLRKVDWEKANESRIKRYEMMLRVTKHSVRRKKIIKHLRFLKGQN
jgi:hypothetical protein